MNELRRTVAASGNMGNCTGLTWHQITDRFLNTYLGVQGYSEHELRRIDDKWRRLSSEVGWKVGP